jgi:hypothetical protein
MKHNIIKTEKYLLAIDDSEIKVGDWFYLNDANIIAEYISVKPVNEAKKITAHLPLNNSPVLEGVPLLPPLEDGVEKLAKEFATKPLNPSNPTGTITDLSLQLGFKSGYKKAKEKYKYTEEDLRKCWKACLDFNKPAGGDSGINLEDFIQSLQQPKMPFGFECEEIYCGYMEDEALIKPKTTTNPQGQTVLAGKYIFFHN